MTIRIVFALVLVVLVGSHGYTQLPPTPTPTPIVPTIPPSPTPIVPTIPALSPPLAIPSTPVLQPVKEKSLDQVLDELVALRTQKAEIEKKEQELIKAIQQKATKQADRMKQLGITSPAESKGPVRIHLIKIEGNERTSDGKIMKMVDFSPGQVLEYPELEKARMRLEKAGFQRAAVEVIPNEGDSNYIDILIRVVEKER
jgi:hypothetical protein